jgi:hypothetical protein
MLHHRLGINILFNPNIDDDAVHASRPEATNQKVTTVLIAVVRKRAFH